MPGQHDHRGSHFWQSGLHWPSLLQLCHHTRQRGGLLCGSRIPGLGPLQGCAIAGIRHGATTAYARLVSKRHQHVHRISGSLGRDYDRQQSRMTWIAVQRVGTSLTLTSSSIDAAAQSFMFTVTLTSAAPSGQPTRRRLLQDAAPISGQVIAISFGDGSPDGTVTTNSNGTASVVHRYTARGTFRATARYAGMRNSACQGTHVRFLRLDNQYIAHRYLASLLLGTLLMNIPASTFSTCRRAPSLL